MDKFKFSFLGKQPVPNGQLPAPKLSAKAGFEPIGAVRGLPGSYGVLHEADKTVWRALSDYLEACQTQAAANASTALRAFSADLETRQPPVFLRPDRGPTEQELGRLFFGIDWGREL